MAAPGPTPVRIVAALLAGLAVALPLTAVQEGNPGKSYLDTGRVLTGGYGHTGPDVPKAGTEVSKDQATRWLAEDLLKHGLDIARPTCLYPEVLVELPAYKVAAVQDFAFNVGVGAFCKSTLVKRVNAHDPKAGDEFDKWVFVAKKDCRVASSNCRGIPIRRMCERTLFEGKPLPAICEGRMQQ